MYPLKFRCGDRRVYHLALKYLKVCEVAFSQMRKNEVVVFAGEKVGEQGVLAGMSPETVRYGMQIAACAMSHKFLEELGDNKVFFKSVRGLIDLSRDKEGDDWDRVRGLVYQVVKAYPLQEMIELDQNELVDDSLGHEEEI